MALNSLGIAVAVPSNMYICVCEFTDELKAISITLDQMTTLNQTICQIYMVSFLQQGLI